MVKKMIFILSMVFSVPVFALMQIEQGMYELEGYLGVTDTNIVFLTINKNMDSQITFRLSGKETLGLLTKDNHKVLAQIDVKNDFTSSIGSADLVQIKKYLNDSGAVKIYHLPADLKK